MTKIKDDENIFHRKISGKLLKINHNVNYQLPFFKKDNEIFADLCGIELYYKKIKNGCYSIFVDFHPARSAEKKITDKTRLTAMDIINGVSKWTQFDTEGKNCLIYLSQNRPCFTIRYNEIFDAVSVANSLAKLLTVIDHYENIYPVD
ncbi:MAG: hypothetical protein KME29_31270 [Calothrix sp. FI2-JRJ7]|jgi:hypothetical protein|nr:hypothetical protein [Calothrix sp. FI2-JRJ7]